MQTDELELLMTVTLQNKSLKLGFVQKAGDAVTTHHCLCCNHCYALAYYTKQ